jgi:hypothetical protein
MAAAIGLLAAAHGVPLWAYPSAALFGSTYIMLTGIILVWSVSVFQERPSAGLGAAFLLIAVGQVFGALAAGAVAEAAGLVASNARHRRLGLPLAGGDYSPECVE